ncbi:MAG: signal recognition particle-docking protein FtsY [Candidatus Thalassarchaeaceae archaeon]|jgi:fused signal recognition particle receptor|nr:signal recognition particle-docking protein FtsY [Candidatus Thalassarchaeaceae archaeon]MDP6703216.1 signal recognition particle-docking protein FtsY [Candidatus Thalassarchaeaceae archaeon]MDP7003987.1 signal recognition particle-docking protein FtsY [Candidatus Thalassarchaeaceae archaeon]
MGLFDRFKKRVEETEETHGITVKEGTAEALEALAERDRLLKHEAISEPTEAPLPPMKDSGWDDIEEELNDPFSSPLSAKDRKRATRQRSAKVRKKANEEAHRARPMETTTGRNLVEVKPASFAIDLGDDSTTRGGRILKGGPALEGILKDLETDLLSADMGHAAVTELISVLRTHLIGARITRKTELAGVVERALRGALRDLLESGYWDFDRTVQAFVAEETPVSIMIVGVNGTGKTTTTAKIAKRLKDQGHEVVLAAADTFRAGAIDQLSIHAERLGVRCISSQRGGDSAAIARDAIESATARGEDIVIIDTAGRMQNKSNLMEELRKVHRVTSPHLVIFVADALAGNDAVTQAAEFQRMLTFDGAALCKLDTDARGGAALSISHATGRPIVLAGLGQGYDDLEPFDPEWLLDTILA